MTNILDSFRLDNKIALVTGSAGGMGQAIAVALAQAGCTIATHDIRPPAETVTMIEGAGGKAAAFSADLSDTAAPEQLFKQVTEKFGRVDILVNNAGIILREDAVNVPLADWQKVIQINETAVFQAPAGVNPAKPRLREYVSSVSGDCVLQSTHVCRPSATRAF